MKNNEVNKNNQNSDNSANNNNISNQDKEEKMNKKETGKATNSKASDAKTTGAKTTSAKTTGAKATSSKGTSSKATKDTKVTKDTKTTKDTKATKGTGATKANKTPSSKSAAVRAEKTKPAGNGEHAYSVPLIQLMLDPSEKDVPGRNLAEDYLSGMGKFMKVKNTRISHNVKYMYSATSFSRDKIIRHFDARLVDPPKVVKRGSTYELIDGGKTYDMLCEIHKRMGVSEFDIMCRVYKDLDIKDQARMYAKQDECHDRLPMGYQIRALEVAEDPEILEFLKVTRESGFAIKPGDGKARNGFIAATCAALRAFRRLGADNYLKMLKVIHKTWAGEKWSVTKYMLAGMTGVMLIHDIDIESFAQKLRHVTYSEIWDKVREFRGMSMDGRFTAALTEFFEGLPFMGQEDQEEDAMPQDEGYAESLPEAV